MENDRPTDDTELDEGVGPLEEVEDEIESAIEHPGRSGSSGR